jgi:YHS domain-containing protein
MTRIAIALCLALTLFGCKKKEPEKPAGAHVGAPGAAGTPGAAPQTKPSDVKVQTAGGPELKVGDVTKCPVSGETFTIDAKSPTATYQGKKYYFCCEKCAGPFNKDPMKYLKSS